LLLLSLILAAGLSSHIAAAQTPIEPIAIEVAGNRITLAPADADAFQRRLNQPPQLQTPPAAHAPSYVVTTTYWDSTARQDDDEATLEAEAEYFPVGGFVRARQDGEDVWLVLDLRQRATLDRYIRFGVEVDRPVSRPGALALITFAAQTGTVGIEAGGQRLSDAEAGPFWDAVASVATMPAFSDRPQAPVSQDVPGYWLTFSLPEGRAQQYFLDTANGSLTDALGTESYDVSELIGGVLPATGGATPIEQDDPAGSRVWWLLAAMGGATVIGLAFWRRRQVREIRGPFD